MPTARIQYLVDKYFADDCSPSELEELAAWVDQAADDEELKVLLAEAWRDHVPLVNMPEEMSARIVAGMFRKKIEADRQSVRGVYPMRRWVAAAAVLLVIAGGTWYFQNGRQHEKPKLAKLTIYKGDVLPGHSGAVLHLSNGQEVILDSAKNGTVAMQGGMQVIKEDGEVRYAGAGSNAPNEEAIYNDITTARGRQWQLTLPDGSRVWLNAASSIHYPLVFKGDVREVSITGEAYFEVAHHAGQAFRVKVGGQVIEDIGTAFNINAYDDEPVVKTTLAEGAIRVSEGTASVLVKPGEQVEAQNGRLEVTHGNIGQATAWRRGIFSFRHAGIPDLMRQLARWYNVDVEFKGSVSPEITFTGDMSRSLSLAQVLHGLRGMNVHFRIEEDKKIVVLP